MGLRFRLAATLDYPRGSLAFPFGTGVAALNSRISRLSLSPSADGSCRVSANGGVTPIPPPRTCFGWMVAHPGVEQFLLTADRRYRNVPSQPLRPVGHSYEVRDSAARGRRPIAADVCGYRSAVRTGARSTSRSISGMALITGQCSGRGTRGGSRKAVFYFRSRLTLPGG